MTPKAGPTWIVAGDAAGSINPFNGEGIAYAYETGRMVADAVARGAARPATGSRWPRYPDRLDDDLRPVLQGGPHVREGRSATRR